jgi:hypothetical protein
MDEREARLVNQVSTLFHNANLKKPVNVASVMPSCSMPMSSTPKIVDFPYGMLMNFPKGQVGPSAGVVGTNPLSLHSTYTTPTTIIPQTHNV